MRAKGKAFSASLQPLSVATLCSHELRSRLQETPQMAKYYLP